MKLLNKINVSLMPKREGVYFMYNRNRKLVYVGVAKDLKHRLQAYVEVDDFKAHPTKLKLRRSVKFFDYKIMPLSKARIIENGHKHILKFNHR